MLIFHFNGVYEHLKAFFTKSLENPDLYKEKENTTKARSRAAQCVELPELYKLNENKTRANSRSAQRQKDEIALKRKQNEDKDQYRQKQRKKDYNKTKTDQNNQQTKSRAKRKVQHGADRPLPGVRATKIKRVEDANDRHKSFRVATMVGPDFICVSCHVRCFRPSVVVLTDKLENKIDSLKLSRPMLTILSRERQYCTTEGHYKELLGNQGWVSGRKTETSIGDDLYDFSQRLNQLLK